MWSAWTSTLFFVPQFLAHSSNQVSYAGTKCDDIRILSVPALANPPGPACAAPAAAVGAAACGAFELQAARSDPTAISPPPSATVRRKRRRFKRPADFRLP